MIKKEALLLVVIIAFGAFYACQPHSEKTPGKLIWEDDFSNAEIDSEAWSKVHRGTADWNNLMSDEDTLYAIRDGKLILRGINNTIASHDSVPFLTGGIHSKGKVGFGFGRWEIRAKLNGATGAWPAIWLMPNTDDKKWPNGGEIDIMERLSHENQVYQTVHSHYTLNLGEDDNPPHSEVTSFDSGNYNVFSVEVHPDKIVFFVNEEKTLVYPKIETDKEGQFPYSNNDFYLILSMQLGGEWVGKVNPDELPIEMEIDWVRFYKFDN